MLQIYLPPSDGLFVTHNTSLSSFLHLFIFVHNETKEIYEGALLALWQLMTLTGL